MFAIIFAFININNTNVFGAFFSNNLAGLELYINIITTVLFIISTIATIVSGCDYLKNFKNLILEDKK